MHKAKKECEKVYNGMLPTIKVIDYFVERKEIPKDFKYAWNFDFIDELNNSTANIKENLPLATTAIFSYEDIINMSTARSSNIFYTPSMKSFNVFEDKTNYKTFCVKEIK